MNLILGLAIIVGIIVATVLFFATAMKLVWWLVVGLVVGAIARLILPGRQSMGWLSTALCGIAGALIGGLVANEVFSMGTLGEIVLSLVAAVAVVALFAGTLGRSDDADRAAV